MKIERRIAKNNRNTYKGLNPCKYITVHQTGNKLKGANASKHATLLENGWKSTWHYTVDSEGVVQHFEDTVQCWHCGDGRGKGNTQSIGVELCINSDGDYLKTIYNAIELVAHLCNKHGIPHGNIKQHYDWSKKNCPEQIRAGVQGVTWSKFKAGVHSILKGVTETVVVHDVPEKTITELAHDVIKGKYGDGATRKRLLSGRYDVVQKEVNRILRTK